MYHVFRCVYELLLNAMDCFIVAVNYMFYSELNVFLYLNACDYIMPVRIM
jgi:hypothetical protein